MVNGEKISPEQQEQLLIMMLIQQHEQIAMMGMGKIKHPAMDEIKRDLSQAKFAIDTLSALQKFTKGNLNAELDAYLNQTLTNLRLNYVDEQKKEDSTDANNQSEE